MVKLSNIFNQMLKFYFLIVLLTPLIHQADTPDEQNSSPQILTAREIPNSLRKHNDQAPPEEQIYDLVSYKKFYHKIPGAPENPFRYYKNFFQILHDLYFTYPEFLNKLNEHNIKHSIHRRIHNDRSYRVLRHILGKKAPPYPLQFYKKEWMGWAGILKQCKHVFK